MNSAVKQRIADIQRGDVPAGYQKTKLGIIPADWGTPELNSVLTENKERNRSGRFGKEDVLSVSGEFGVTNQIELLGRSFAGASVKDYHIVEAGNIVYTKSPLKENPYGIIKLNKGSAGIVSTLYAVYNCKTPVTGLYLDYYFSLDQNVNNYLRPLVRKGTKNDMKINNEDVLKGCVILPPESEIAKIVEILGCCDRMIALKKELIAEKKKQKKALMQKLLNPDSGFRLPVIREKITQVHFNDICRFINGRAYSQDELLETGKYRVLRVGNLFTSDTWYFSNLELPNDKYCQKGDLLYAWSASFGPFIWQGDTTIYHYHIWKVEPCEHVDKMFLYHCLKYDAELLENSIQGGTMSHITKETMERRLCPFVDNLDLQKNIADILSTADKEIDLLEQELVQQEQKKKSLMQLLLTGIVRV